MALFRTDLGTHAVGGTLVGYALPELPDSYHHGDCSYHVVVAVAAAAVVVAAGMTRGPVTVCMLERQFHPR